MTLWRLTPWHAIAWIAAVALIGTTAFDWYSTTQGQANRRDESLVNPPAGPGGQDLRELKRDLAISAEQREGNPWEVGTAVDTSALDILLVIVLLGAVLATIAASLFRAAAKEAKPPLTPSLYALAVSVLAALLVAYRMVQQPGINEVATIEIGLYLALVALGILIIANARAWQAEQEPIPSLAEEPSEAAPFDQFATSIAGLPPAPPPRADQAQPGPPPRPA